MFFVAISVAFLYCQPCNCQTGNVHNGHEWVDLGLSVKWATCNIGASKPEDYGKYYAWGETGTKREFMPNNYKYYNRPERSFTKYCVDSRFGIVDNETCLNHLDDAAQNNWYGMWRMPTKAEFDELLSNCDLTFTDNYNGTGVKGCVFRSLKEGYTDKSIFLPAAGFREGTRFTDAGYWGYYWSSSLAEEYCDGVALVIPHSSMNFLIKETRSHARWDGLPIRPVIEFTGTE